MLKDKMKPTPGDLSGPESCTERLVEITEKDLPLSCPPLQDRIWDAHPRVYLPIAEAGKVACPYCGTSYILKGYNSL